MRKIHIIYSSCALLALIFLGYRCQIKSSIQDVAVYKGQLYILESKWSSVLRWYINRNQDYNEIQSGTTHFIVDSRKRFRLKGVGEKFIINGNQVILFVNTRTGSIIQTYNLTNDEIQASINIPFLLDKDLIYFDEKKEQITILNSGPEIIVLSLKSQSLEAIGKETIISGFSDHLLVDESNGLFNLIGSVSSFHDVRWNTVHFTSSLPSTFVDSMEFRTLVYPLFYLIDTGDSSVVIEAFLYKEHMFRDSGAMIYFKEDVDSRILAFQNVQAIEVFTDSVLFATLGGLYLVSIDEISVKKKWSIEKDIRVIGIAAIEDCGFILYGSKRGPFGIPQSYKKEYLIAP